MSLIYPLRETLGCVPVGAMMNAVMPGVAPAP